MTDIVDDCRIDLVKYNLNKLLTLHKDFQRFIIKLL